MLPAFDIMCRMSSRVMAAPEGYLLTVGGKLPEGEFEADIKKFCLINGSGGRPSRRQLQALQGQQPAKLGPWKIDLHFLDVGSAEGGYEFCGNTHGGLPLSCINSAEHVMRCYSLGQLTAYERDEKKRNAAELPDVLADFGNVETNISQDELISGYKDRAFTGKDLKLGDGLILAHKSPDTRKEGSYTCHAAAIVAYNKLTGEMIVTSIFANSRVEESMAHSMRFDYLKSAHAFAAVYQQDLPRRNYALGKLAIAPQ
jgi:hypothetical protein